MRGGVLSAELVVRRGLCNRFLSTRRLEWSIGWFELGWLVTSSETPTRNWSGRRKGGCVVPPPVHVTCGVAHIDTLLLSLLW